MKKKGTESFQSPCQNVCGTEMAISLSIFSKELILCRISIHAAAAEQMPHLQMIYFIVRTRYENSYVIWLRECSVHYRFSLRELSLRLEIAKAAAIEWTSIDTYVLEAAWITSLSGVPHMAINLQIRPVEIFSLHILKTTAFTFRSCCSPEFKKKQAR